jgi:hypothetical protein
MNSVSIALLMLTLCAGIAHAEEQERGLTTRNVYVTAQLPSIEFAISASAATPVSPYTLVGITTYAGGFPMAGGGTNTALFSRSFLFNGSFFGEARVGYMKTTWGHPNLKSASGASYGFEIGNHWFHESGFHQGVSWFGIDRYMTNSHNAGLIHLPRYELGFSF